MLKELFLAPVEQEINTPCGDPRKNRNYRFGDNVLFKCSINRCVMSCPAGHVAIFKGRKFSKADCKSKKGKTKWNPKKGQYTCEKH